MAATPITAYAAYSALGTNIEQILAGLADGRSGITSIDNPRGTSRCWGRVADPPPLSEPFAEFDCRAGRLVAAVAADLVEPVAVARRRWGSDRVAVVLGTHSPDTKWLRDEVEGDTATATVHARGAQGPLLLARELLELKGPAYCVAAEGAAGAAAIASAHRLIAAGLADAVVAGGVGVLSSLAAEAYSVRRLLSEDPARPLCASRAGTSLGEGAALLLIERHGDAFLELGGVAEAQDGTGGGRAAVPAMNEALRCSGVAAESIGFVQLHAPGTITHDFLEAGAVRECFGERMPVASMVGATGLVLGAAGAIDLIVAAACIGQGFIPPTIGCDPPDGTLGVTATVARRELEHDYAMVHAVSLGGRSIAMVVGARG